jgi:hypothetical protein
MNIQAEVKQSNGGVEVRLSGSDAGKIDGSRVQAFLQSRMACQSRNHCQAKDSAATKAKCLTDLIEHKFAEQTARAGVARSTVIRLEGEPALLKYFATPERVRRLVDNFAACQSKNHCSPQQGLVERWNCVNTLAQHILQR